MRRQNGRGFGSLRIALGTFLLTFLVGFPDRSAAAPPVPRPRYEIEARVASSAPQIDGVVRVDFTNSAETTIDEAVFLLFPNRFAAADDDNGVNDFNRPFVYPEEDFDPGSLEIVAIHDGETEREPQFIDAPGVPPRCVLRVPIEPLQPGDTRRLTVRFETTVPHRFGSFGEFENQLTLIGGWHPYLTALQPDGTWLAGAWPPVADFEVTLTATSPLHVVLNAHEFLPGESIRNVSVPGVHYLSLVAAPELLRTEVTAGQTRILFLRRPSRRTFRVSFEPPPTEILTRTLRDIVDLRPTAVPQPPPALLVVEAPLRLHLAAAGEGNVVLSDRALKMHRLIRPFHERQLAQATYQEIFRPRLITREPQRDYWWVSEGLSRVLADRFVGQAYPDNRSVHDWIDRFNIFSLVDRFESEPRIPFVDAFFEHARASDPLHAQITTFNHSLPPGHITFGQLRELLGTPEFDSMIDDCSETAMPFRACVTGQAGPRLEALLDQSTTPYPTVNYRFESVEWNQSTHDGYRTKAAVRRESSRPFTEPVTVRLRGLAMEPVDVLWTGEGDVGKIEATTRRRVLQAVIDPDRKVIEQRRDDNARPASPQILLDTADVAVTSTEFGLSGLLVGRNRYDYRKDLAMAGFFTNRSLGFTVGPRWHGGTPIDATRFRHNVYAFYGFQKLDESFKDERNPSIRTSGELASLGLRYDYTNVFALENPTRQRQVRLHFDWYDDALGGDFSYLDWGVQLVATQPLWNGRNIGAIQLLNGFSQPLGNSEVPNQGLYSLGGARSIRGIGVEKELARNVLILRTEWRHSVYPEMDLNFLDLLVLRRGQLRLFADTGRVSNSAGQIYNPSGFAVGFGVGVAAVYEFLGFFPAVGYIEVATRPSKPSDVQFLFGTRQSF